MGSKAFAWRESSSRIIFLITILIQAIIVAALEIYIFTAVISKISDDHSLAQASGQNNTPNSLLVYLIIFIMSQLLQIYMTLEAIAYKNTLQIIGIVVFNVMSTAYSWTQYVQIKENINTFASGSSVDYDKLKETAKIVLACMGSAMIVCELVLIVFAYKLYQEFGWSIYRLIGSDLTMRRLYLNYQMLVMFLKFDVFFFLGFSIQFLILALNTDDPEFYITLVAIPLSLVILVGVVQGVRREHKAITLVSMMGFLLGLAYFIFKTYRIFDTNTAYKYAEYKKFLTLFAILSIVALTASYILALLCYLNFGKGLERHIHPSNTHNLERPAQAHIDLGDE